MRGLTFVRKDWLEEGKGARAILSLPEARRVYGVTLTSIELKRHFLHFKL
jgi:hypothetical protein